MRSETVFRGYFRDEEATAAVLTGDGWLRTGDIGELERAFNATAATLQVREDERNQAEQQLRQSREDYRSLVQNAPVGIFRATADGRLLMVNPRLVEILGYTSESEVMARRATEFYTDPADRVKVLETRVASGAITSTVTHVSIA